MVLESPKNVHKKVLESHGKPRPVLFMHPLDRDVRYPILRSSFRVYIIVQKTVCNYSHKNMTCAFFSPTRTFLQFGKIVLTSRTVRVLRGRLICIVLHAPLQQRSALDARAWPIRILATICYCLCCAFCLFVAGYKILRSAGLACRQVVAVVHGGNNIVIRMLRLRTKVATSVRHSTDETTPENQQADSGATQDTQSSYKTSRIRFVSIL